MTAQAAGGAEGAARAARDDLTETTIRVANRWVATPYYDAVEAMAESQWTRIIQPFLAGETIDYTQVLELAVGHGRMTRLLLDRAFEVTGVDVLQENIDFCAKRFKAARNLRLIRNDGVTLAAVGDGSISFVFCFDSMIHFDSDVVRAYLAEFRRVMEPGAKAFLHHSNLTRNPGGDFQRNAHARNFMSVQMFKHYAMKEGLTVLRQKVIDWGQGDKRVKGLDGLTLLRRD
jgi:ubiquinone/menaquinone biosynthesis C-methylase UbiE